MSASWSELCNAVEDVPGPLPGRCSRPPHDDGDHCWDPSPEALRRADLQRQALTAATAAAISQTRFESRMVAALDTAGAGDRLPGRGKVRRVLSRWPA